MKEDLALTSGEMTSLDGLNVLGLGSFTGISVITYNATD
jgi:hypothetical protein